MTELASNIVGNSLDPCRVDDQLILDIHHRVRHFEVGIHFPGPERSHTRLKFLDGSDVPFDKLDSQQPRSLPRQLGGLDGNRIAGVVECHYPAELRDNLLQDLQALRGEVGARVVDACESSPRSCEALHEPENNRVGPGTENDGDVCRRPLCCYGAGVELYISG